MPWTVDREELDRLVAEHLPTALRLAERLTGDPHAAEEAVQDSLVNVLRRLRGFRGDASLRTWWMRIVVNACRDRYRRRPREEPIETDAIDRAAGPAELATAAETLVRVSREIDKLPTRQREVAIVCIAEGCDNQQAAELLGVTPQNIGATLHLVRKRLAAALGDTIP